nr:hypothetical protein Iba_chr08eCG11690 [Ipomoea batatas]
MNRVTFVNMLYSSINIFINISSIKFQFSINKMLHNISNKACLKKTEEIHQAHKFPCLIAANMSGTIYLINFFMTKLAPTKVATARLNRSKEVQLHETPFYFVIV